MARISLGILKKSSSRETVNCLGYTNDYNEDVCPINSPVIIYRDTQSDLFYSSFSGATYATNGWYSFEGAETKYKMYLEFGVRYHLEECSATPTRTPIYFDSWVPTGQAWQNACSTGNSVTLYQDSSNSYYYADSTGPTLAPNGYYRIGSTIHQIFSGSSSGTLQCP